MNKTKRSPAQQRILDTADRLFYAEGFRAVGIDRIIAEAEVAKMTLYNNFGSKDDLMLAVLEQRETAVVSMFEKNMEKHEHKGANRLDAFFLSLKDWFRSAGYRGCSFINATVELADRTHPASVFATAHKRRFHAMLGKIVMETRGKSAESLLPAIALIVEGAIVSSVMGQKTRAAEVAHSAVLSLLKK